MPLEHFSERERRSAVAMADEADQVREAYRAAFASGPGQLAFAHLGEICLRGYDPLGMLPPMEGATFSERAAVESGRRQLYRYIEALIGGENE